jgi:hypothetical protein
MAPSFEFLFGKLVFVLIEYGQYIGKKFNKCLILAFVKQTNQNIDEAYLMLMEAGKASEEQYLKSLKSGSIPMHQSLRHLLADNMLLDADLLRRIRWPPPWTSYIIVLIKLDSWKKAVKEVALYYNLEPKSGKDFSDMEIKCLSHNANHFQGARLKNNESMNIDGLLLALDSLQEDISNPMDLLFSHYNCHEKDLMPVFESGNVQIGGRGLSSDYESFKIAVDSAAKVIDLSDKSELISIFSSLLNPFSSIFSTKGKVREIEKGYNKSSLFSQGS